MFSRSKTMNFFKSCYSTTGTPAVPEEDDNRVQLMAPTSSSSSSTPNRLTGSKSASAAYWRPKLSMISEDEVAQNFERKNEEILLKKSSRKSRSLAYKSRSVDHRDESRKNPRPIVIPAFMPTPFMF